MSNRDWTGYFADKSAAKIAALGLRLEIESDGMRLIYIDGKDTYPLGAATSAADLLRWLDGFEAGRRHPVAATRDVGFRLEAVE